MKKCFRGCFRYKKYESFDKEFFAFCNYQAKRQTTNL